MAVALVGRGTSRIHGETHRGLLWPKLLEIIHHVNEQNIAQLAARGCNSNVSTKDVVDKRQQFVANGSLIGIIDDRGVFRSTSRRTGSIV